MRLSLHRFISINLDKPGSIFVCDSVWVFEAGLKNSIRFVGTGRRELASGVTASGEEGE
jgi:hypothetical protein